MLSPLRTMGKRLRALLTSRKRPITRKTKIDLELLEDRVVPDSKSLLLQIAPTAMNGFTPLAAYQSQLQATTITNIYKLNGDSTTLAGVASQLSRVAGVSVLGLDQTVQAALSPNDPALTGGTLWGMNGTYGINAPSAWNNATGSTKINVGIVDTGIDYTHPDLYENVWINQGEIPTAVVNAIKANPNWDVDGDGKITFWDLNDARNQGTGKIRDLDGDGRITGADILKPVAQGGWADGTDTDGNGYVDDLIGWDWVNNDNNPYDDNSHGTHVAGTIGGIGNNGTGVVGVNWKVEMAGLKFLDASGSGSTSNAAAAVRYAADMGIQVTNNSWGGSGYSAILDSAISYAAGKNSIFVSAAGNAASNDDTTPDYPSDYTWNNMIVVAATDSAGNLASFSNYGPVNVDIGAPGVNIYSTLPGGGYGYKSGTSMATPHVTGEVALVWSEHPGWTYTQVRTQVLSTAHPLASLNGLVATGGLADAGAATINGPALGLSDSGATLSDGSTDSFGSTFTGTPVTHTFTVTNLGTATLTLGTITTPSGYTLTSGPGSTSLAPGASTTFQVRMDAAAAGTYSGSLVVNSNASAGAMHVNLTGVAGNSVIVDDGDAAFSATSGWTNFVGQGYLNDVHFAAAGSGSAVASWVVSNLTPGQYRVSATWSTDPNRATNSPFTVYDGSTALQTIAVNQELTPNDRTDQGVGWKDLGVFTISGTTLKVALSNLANEYVIADGIRVEKLSAAPAAPQIQVQDAGSTVANGSTVSFGSTTTGTSVSKTFTVSNLGSQNLTLGSITAPSGFTVTGNFGTTTVTPGASTTFTVRLDATTAGSYSGQLSFATNDANANPFTLTLQGTVSTPAAPPTVVIIDDGDSGFSTSGGWTNFSGQGYQNDVHYAAAGSGAAVASWVFSGLSAGQYRVSATWSVDPNRATNSPFTVYDGATALQTVAVNQELTPSDRTDQGVGWKDLGTFTISGSSLKVSLSNLANEYVIADGIRIERMTAAPVLQLSDGANPVANGSVVSFGTTTPGTPVSKTFTVRNAGSQNLTLGTLSAPAGFTVTAGFGATTLAPGASTTFTVRLDAASVSSYSGQLTFGSNDASANPFAMTLQGSVSSGSSVIIVDDGDAGFSTSGGWTNFVGQGLQNDVHYAAAGSGSAVASWTFSNLAAGRYRVSATWSTDPNRATNAPFTVYDGAAALQTVAVNQQLAPSDRTDQGVGWKDLGTFTISGASLKVALSNLANQYVIADAIRIEYLGAAPPPGSTTIVDDGDSGFSTAGGWTNFAGQGYQNDVHYAAAGSGSAVASWAFSGLAAGQYRISVTWSADPNRATNAPFTVYDGATALQTVAVNEQSQPSDLSDQGVWWKDLGTFTITGSSVTVSLSNLANGYVIADAVRIEKVG